MDALNDNMYNVLSEEYKSFNEDINTNKSFELSPPMSLPYSPLTQTSFRYDSNTKVQLNRPPRYCKQVGELRSIEEIPSNFRHVFSQFPYFNNIQSKVMDDVLYSDVPLVVSAPTGSGKTVIFELAIIQLLMAIENTNYAGNFKIIYIAPMKALCSERLVDWVIKFQRLGIRCIEVTGDTDRIEFRNLEEFKIIITTPEKWNSLTRKWKDNRAIVEVVKLFMIDEIHILNDKQRGPSLEAIISRMKTIEASIKNEEQCRNDEHGYPSQKLSTSIRFIALSATIKNIEDIAQWLGKSSKYYHIGEEHRPVILNKIVLGYPCQYNCSPFKFDLSLNYRLNKVITDYSENKPSLVFCSTRKGMLMAAEVLSKNITFNFSYEQQNNRMASIVQIEDKKLCEIATAGIGFHHAGMSPEDKSIIEDLFRMGVLPVLLTTSTLAMGVNLPAHLVVIKSTEMYNNGGYEEYGEIALLQMIGRAGRPQFDSTATAVIMTKISKQEHYQKLVGGQQLIESSLHKHLGEHLNAEVVLHTITNLSVAMEWIRTTFLYVRAMKNPSYYGFYGNNSTQQIEYGLNRLCQNEITKLKNLGMLTVDEENVMNLSPTRSGELMALYCLSVNTMQLFTEVKGSESILQMLQLISRAHEFEDVPLRVSDKRILNELNKCKKSNTIRFPFLGRIQNRDMKVCCIIQSVLGRLPIIDISLKQESIKIMRIAERVAGCLAEYLQYSDRAYTSHKNTVTLVKCFSAALWEDSPYVSIQLEKIGPVLSSILVSAGKTSFEIISNSNPRDLERIINKAPPMGNNIKEFVDHLPKYYLSIETPSSIDKPPLYVHVSLKILNIDEVSVWSAVGKNHKIDLIVGDSENNLLLSEKFTDKQLIEEVTKTVELKFDEEHFVFAHIISKTWVGIDIEVKLKVPPIKLYMRKNTSIYNINVVDLKKRISNIDIKKDNDTDEIMSSKPNKINKNENPTYDKLLRNKIKILDQRILKPAEKIPVPDQLRNVQRIQTNELLNSKFQESKTINQINNSPKIKHENKMHMLIQSFHDSTSKHPNTNKTNISSSGKIIEPMNSFSIDDNAKPRISNEKSKELLQNNKKTLRMSMKNPQCDILIKKSEIIEQQNIPKNYLQMTQKSIDSSGSEKPWTFIEKELKDLDKNIKKLIKSKSYNDVNVPLNSESKMCRFRSFDHFEWDVRDTLNCIYNDNDVNSQENNDTVVWSKSKDYKNTNLENKIAVTEIKQSHWNNDTISVDINLNKDNIKSTNDNSKSSENIEAKPKENDFIKNLEGNENKINKTELTILNNEIILIDNDLNKNDVKTIDNIKIKTNQQEINFKQNENKISETKMFWNDEIVLNDNDFNEDNIKTTDNNIKIKMNKPENDFKQNENKISETETFWNDEIDLNDYDFIEDNIKTTNNNIKIKMNKQENNFKQNENKISETETFWNEEIVLNDNDLNKNDIKTTNNIKIKTNQQEINFKQNENKISETKMFWNDEIVLNDDDFNEDNIKTTNNNNKIKMNKQENNFKRNENKTTDNDMNEKKGVSWKSPVFCLFNDPTEHNKNLIYNIVANENTDRQIVLNNADYITKNSNPVKNLQNTKLLKRKLNNERTYEVTEILVNNESGETVKMSKDMIRAEQMKKLKMYKFDNKSKKIVDIVNKSISKSLPFQENIKKNINLNKVNVNMKSKTSKKNDLSQFSDVGAKTEDMKVTKTNYHTSISKLFSSLNNSMDTRYNVESVVNDSIENGFILPKKPQKYVNMNIENLNLRIINDTEKHRFKYNKKPNKNEISNTNVLNNIPSTSQYNGRSINNISNSLQNKPTNENDYLEAGTSASYFFQNENEKSDFNYPMKQNNPYLDFFPQSPNIKLEQLTESLIPTELIQPQQLNEHSNNYEQYFEPLLPNGSIQQQQSNNYKQYYEPLSPNGSIQPNQSMKYLNNYERYSEPLLPNQQQSNNYDPLLLKQLIQPQHLNDYSNNYEQSYEPSLPNGLIQLQQSDYEHYSEPLLPNRSIQQQTNNYERFSEPNQSKYFNVEYNDYLPNVSKTNMCSEFQNLDSECTKNSINNKKEKFLTQDDLVFNRFDLRPNEVIKAETNINKNNIQSNKLFDLSPTSFFRSIRSNFE